MEEKKYYAVFKITARSTPKTLIKEKKLQAFKQSLSEQHGYHPSCRCRGNVYDSKDCAMIKAELENLRRQQAYEDSQYMDHTFTTRYYIHECYVDGWLKLNSSELKNIEA